jgi:hypothetical protein
LRTAIANLSDDTPIMVSVATDEDGVADDQVAVSGAYVVRGWGGERGDVEGPEWSLNCYWPHQVSGGW